MTWTLDYETLSPQEVGELHELVLDEIAVGYLYSVLIVEQGRRILPASLQLVSFYKPEQASPTYMVFGAAAWQAEDRVCVELSKKSAIALTPDDPDLPLLCEAVDLTSQLAEQASVDVVARLLNSEEYGLVRSTPLEDFAERRGHGIFNQIRVFGHERGVVEASPGAAQRKAYFLGRRLVRDNSVAIGDLVINLVP
mgnify:CR=1 FL=1